MNPSPADRLENSLHRNWHTLSQDQVKRLLKTDASGLTDGDARLRLAHYGPYRLTPASRRGAAVGILRLAGTDGVGADDDGGSGLVPLGASGRPSIETARAMAVNAVVVAEVFYLINSRFIFLRVLNREGLTGNRYVLLAIAACIPLQLAYTHAPFMQAVSDSTDLSLTELIKVLAAGVLVFGVSELEKFVMRRTQLAARLSLA